MSSYESKGHIDANSKHGGEEGFYYGCDSSKHSDYGAAAAAPIEPEYRFILR